MMVHRLGMHVTDQGFWDDDLTETSKLELSAVFFYRYARAIWKLCMKWKMITIFFQASNCQQFLVTNSKSLGE